jgi:hypothetical protein
MRGFLGVVLALVATACSTSKPPPAPTVPPAIAAMLSQRPWVAPMVAALEKQHVATTDDVNKITAITTYFEGACMSRRSSNHGATWDAAELRADLAKHNLADVDDTQAYFLSLAYEVMCGQEPITLPT